MIDGHDPHADSPESLSQPPAEIAALGAMSLEASEARLITPEDDDYEDKVFDTILAFVESHIGQPFTYGDMEASLQGGGIAIDGPTSKKHKMLIGMLDEAVAVVDEGSPQESIDFARVNVGKQRGFVVAPAGHKAPPKQPPQLPIRKAVESSVFQRPLAYTRAPMELPKYPHEEQHRKRVISLLRLQPELRGNQVRHQVSEMLELPPDEAQELLGRMIDDGILYRSGQGKSRRYSEQPIPDGETDGRPGVKKSKPEGLSDREKRLAPVVLDAVTAVLHVSQLLTPRQVVRKIQEQKLSAEDIVERDVKSIVRQLERQGIMLQTKARQGHKSPRSKRVEVMKVGLASQQVKDLYRDEDGRALILSLVQSGGQLDSAESDAGE